MVIVGRFPSILLLLGLEDKHPLFHCETKKLACFSCCLHLIVIVSLSIVLKSFAAKPFIPWITNSMPDKIFQSHSFF